MNVKFFYKRHPVLNQFIIFLSYLPQRHIESVYRIFVAFINLLFCRRWVWVEYSIYPPHCFKFPSDILIAIYVRNSSIENSLFTQNNFSIKCIYNTEWERNGKGTKWYKKKINTQQRQQHRYGYQQHKTQTI